MDDGPDYLTTASEFDGIETAVIAALEGTEGNYSTKHLNGGSK